LVKISNNIRKFIGKNLTKTAYMRQKKKSHEEWFSNWSHVLERFFNFGRKVPTLHQSDLTIN